jgi:hypothetical protein
LLRNNSSNLGLCHTELAASLVQRTFGASSTRPSTPFRHGDFSDLEFRTFRIRRM